MHEQVTTYLTILLLPLAAFLIQMFFGRRLPRGGDWISIAAVGVAFLLSLSVFFKVVLAGDPGWSVGWRVDRWLPLAGGTTFGAGILVDNLTSMMLVVVTLVSLLVHLFSVGYMAGDRDYSRFFGYLSVFSFSMLLLVLSDNLISLFAGWELVGLSSYLLIGFWLDTPMVSPDIVPAEACKKAFIVNRVGDLGFLIGILIIYSVTNQTKYGKVFEAVGLGELSGTLLTVAGLCLFMGAIGKSAQFPLHVWLPDAMAGPTPVSALIHAATMVAAGVYMVGRLFPVMSPDALTVIAYVGGLTAIFAASIAVTMTDIKRVLAYSTASQLGYMVMGLGVGTFGAGLFHLMTHAWFKACLFLASGSVIHAMHHALHHAHDESDPQDMRHMGGLKDRMPWTFRAMMLATLAISGVPFTSGFLSKDAILAGTLGFSWEHPTHFLLPLFGFAAAALTAFYMFRLMFMTFFGEFKKGSEIKEHVHESPAVMTVPLIVLSSISLWIFYNWNPFSAEGWFLHLITVPTVGTMTNLVSSHGPGWLHYAALGLSLAVASAGIGLAWTKYKNGSISLEAWAAKDSGFYRLLANKYYIDEFYSKTAIRATLALSRIVAAFDKHVVDGVVNGVGVLTRAVSWLDGKFDNLVVDGLVNLTGTVVISVGDKVRQVQTGRIQQYVLVSVLGLVILVLFWPA
ncbi:MAG: NADH-quinone oxidoreductase subunit L [Candidatus Latescibacteria bacterium]|nr:NADH-quinone oxidoreductase subunit L [Candidatus Latescibacterota bacterium]